MNEGNKELSRQMAAAYGEGGACGRVIASVLLAVALVALFIYRAATTDPLWETEQATTQAEGGAD